MEPEFLTVEDVLGLHEEQIALYGGSAGVRDQSVLESAVQMPASGFGESFFHEDLAAMAGAYLFHIVKNHPFVDGNKRTGLHAALVFLDVNGYLLDAPDGNVEAKVLAVASGIMSKEAAARFIREHLMALPES